MNRLLRFAIIFTFLLSACTHRYAIISEKHSHTEIKLIKDDSLANTLIFPYKKIIDAKMQEVIAVSDTVLTKDGYESTLANFVMLAMEHYFSAYKPELKNQIIPFINRGGLRINLPKGKIKTGTIYELMPFDNEIVLLKIKGEKLNEALQSFCENGKLFNHHISFYKDGNRVINPKIYNENLDDNKEYYILTTDYLAGGGDNSHFFGNPVLYENTGTKLRDAIIGYCRFLTQSNLHIKAIKDGRITGTK